MNNVLRAGTSRLLVGLILVLAIVSCSRGARELPDVGVELAIAPEPPQLGPATVTVTLTDSGGAPISGASVELEGNMSHAGMVPVLGRAAEVAPGRYQAELEFTMAGDWFILVRAELPDGRSMERVIDIPGVDEVCGDTPTP